MTHQLQVGESVSLSINAADFYSIDVVIVAAGQQFQFYTDPTQRWNDWFVSSSPDGYFNLFASLWGMRTKNTKCFCLCGVFNQDETTTFKIGSTATIAMADSGDLNFFANDSRGFYSNNKGAIIVGIKRVV